MGVYQSVLHVFGLLSQNKITLVFDDFVLRFLLVGNWKAIGVNANM